MDEPRAPDDARDWNAMNIFLFTNGQENSPPRKYHLKTEELKWWDATLSFLARSQFGSMHSNIELYTLEGKKINTPLDLTNDAAYVAVNPPDTFVQTGYEKYLLKASRSREKRHEKLNDSGFSKILFSLVKILIRLNTFNFENKDINRDQLTTNINVPYDIKIGNGKNTESDLRLPTEIENLTIVESNAIPQSKKDTESPRQIETTNNSLTIEKPEMLLAKRGGNTKSTILKKIYPNHNSKDDGQNLNKKRITSFPKNLIKPSNNSKRLNISSYSNNIMKTKMEVNVKAKEDSQFKKSKVAESITNNAKPGQIKNITNTVINSPITSVKDFTVRSDVYTRSDVLDLDRKTALLRTEQNKEPNILGNKMQEGSNLSETPILNNVTQPGTLNINLNIDLKGYTVLKTNEKGHANLCKTLIALIKAEKASQVNDDINLSRETSKFGDEVRARDLYTEAGVANTCEEKNADSTKVIVHCKCNIMEPENATSTSCNFNETDHYTIFIPTEKVDKFLSSRDLETRRGSYKEMQELLQGCVRVPTPNSDTVSNKKPENITRHNVSISQDAPKAFHFDKKQLKAQGDENQPSLLPDGHYKSNNKNENFTQTDWSNILLQAKYHEDGHYTFYLPPLYLLIQYNLI